MVETGWTCLKHTGTTPGMDSRRQMLNKIWTPRNIPPKTIGLHQFWQHLDWSHRAKLQISLGIRLTNRCSPPNLSTFGPLHSPWCWVMLCMLRRSCFPRGFYDSSLGFWLAIASPWAHESRTELMRQFATSLSECAPEKKGYIAWIYLGKTTCIWYSKMLHILYIFWSMYMCLYSICFFSLADAYGRLACICSCV